MSTPTASAPTDLDTVTDADGCIICGVIRDILGGTVLGHLFP